MSQQTWFANIRTGSRFPCESTAERDFMHDAMHPDTLIRIPYTIQKKNEESLWKIVGEKSEQRN